MHLCWFDFKPWLSTAESDSRFGYCPTVDLSLRFCWDGWLTRPRQHFHVPQDLVNVHKSMLFSKSRLQMPNDWHQATTSCRLSLSSRQHFPAICSFFQAYTRGKSAVCPTPTIVPLFWVYLVKPRAAAVFQLLFPSPLQSKGNIFQVVLSMYRWVFLLAHPWIRRAGAALGPSVSLEGSDLDDVCHPIQLNILLVWSPCSLPDILHGLGLCV